MSGKYLLAISIGPVQSFIAAARKTRDLWFGSYLLSDIARQTALCIHNNGGELIFPGVEEGKEKEKLNDKNFSVANVILAIIDNPSDAAKQAETAANEAWNKHVEAAKKKVEEYGKNVLRQDVWDRQKDGFVEFYAAWVSYQENNYKEKRKRIMRILSGRKRLRNFKPEAITYACLPKSSLDGARDTVLAEYLPKEFADKWHIRVNANDKNEYGDLKTTEQLDVIGIVKRVEGKLEENEFENFKSLGAIAINLVIRHKSKSEQERIVKLDDIDDDNGLRKYTADSPYLAVLCADGDKIGAAISKLTKPQEHKDFSIALTRFSQDIKKIVEDHYGALVYAGGDDVLAFLPVDTVLSCARKLSESFKGELKEYDVSLSVGVVIGHYHEMLETLLDFARKAESDAKKPDRNGLAVSMYHRGNAECTVREQWQDNKNSIEKRIKCWADNFRDKKISQKFPYDLQELAKIYEGVRLDAYELKNVLQSEIKAMAKQKQTDENIAKKIAERVTDIVSMKNLVNEMLIAQMIGEVKYKCAEAQKGENND